MEEVTLVFTTRKVFRGPIDNHPKRELTFRNTVISEMSKASQYENIELPWLKKLGLKGNRKRSESQMDVKVGEACAEWYKEHITKYYPDGHVDLL